MLKVKNGKVISNISRKSLKSNISRNVVAVLAVALTTVLFTSLFTVAMSINSAFRQSNFRQVGGYEHGGFKYLTEEQFKEIKTDPLIEEYALRRFVGMPDDETFNKAHVEVGCSDESSARRMSCDPVEGRLPAESTDEAAPGKFSAKPA